MKIKDYCSNADCPVHPDNPNSKSDERIMLSLYDGDVTIEVSIPCTLCNRVERVDMKEYLKNALLKKRLRS